MSHPPPVARPLASEVQDPEHSASAQQVQIQQGKDAAADKDVLVALDRYYSPRNRHRCFKRSGNRALRNARDDQMKMIYGSSQQGSSLGTCSRGPGQFATHTASFHRSKKQV